MNKNTKIWLNYLLGSIICILLLTGIYIQVKKQFATTDISTWRKTGPYIFLYLTIALLPLNILLEVSKWHLLAGSAERITYRQALNSYLAGLAFSIITPNRIGEYPGRILYLQRKNTIRLISVSVLGMTAQLFTLFLFFTASLIYFNVAFPSVKWKIVLLCSTIIMFGMLFIYMRFETWLPRLQKFKWVKKYNVYAQLLKRFSFKEQLTILVLSLLRFSVYTAQYLFFLRWMNVIIPFTEGYWMAAFFFGAMAIIPTIALAELAVRGQLAIFLFSRFSNNILGIVAATTGIWFLNLIIPSVIGSILIIKMRLFRFNE